MNVDNILPKLPKTTRKNACLLLLFFPLTEKSGKEAPFLAAKDHRSLPRIVVVLAADAWLNGGGGGRFVGSLEVLVWDLGVVFLLFFVFLMSF